MQCKEFQCVYGCDGECEPMGGACIGNMCENFGECIGCQDQNREECKGISNK